MAKDFLFFINSFKSNNTRINPIGFEWMKRQHSFFSYYYGANIQYSGRSAYRDPVQAQSIFDSTGEDIAVSEVLFLSPSLVFGVDHYKDRHLRSFVELGINYEVLNQTYQVLVSNAVQVFTEDVNGVAFTASYGFEYRFKPSWQNDYKSWLIGAKVGLQNSKVFSESLFVGRIYFGYSWDNLK